MIPLPHNWQAKRVKHVSHLVTSGSRGWAEFYADDGPAFLRIGNLTERGIDLDLADLQHVQVPAGTEGGRTRVKQGDVLVSITALIGAIGLVRQDIGEAYVNQHLALVRPTSGVDPRWLAYMLRSQPGRDQLLIRMYGGTKVGLGLDDVREVLVPLPPLPAQRALASLLDQKTAAIDALVAKKERMIELLQEKRQALITQAVTKGMEPSAPMKESGVGWLGRIPASWSVLPLRRVLRGIEQGWSPESEDRSADDGEWSVLKLSAISKGRFRPEEQKALPKGTQPERRYEVRAGDLLLTRANTPLLVGDACFVENPPPRLMLPDLIYRLEVRQQLASPAYIARFLLSAPGRAQIMADARGSSMSMAKVAGGHIRSWLVPLPATVDEQLRIVRALDVACASIDSLQQKLENHVSRLREYRQVLITSVVTGQIDVPEEAV